MAYRPTWVRVSEADFWENLRQVLSCPQFSVSSWCDLHGESLGQFYEVEFSDSDGPQRTPVFSLLREPDSHGVVEVRYFIAETNLSLLAMLAAIDSLLGDVVAVS